MIAVPFLRLPSLRLLASRLLLWPPAWPPLILRVLCLSSRGTVSEVSGIAGVRAPIAARQTDLKAKVSEAAVPNSGDDRRGGTCVELFHVPDLGGAHDADDALSCDCQ